MKFAILGGGFSGLSVAWYLLHYTQASASVDLYDPETIGGGPSGMSSGLLHPYTGKYARLAWEAEKCLKETHRLMTVASQAVNKPLILSKGILRPAISEQQMRDFQICAQNYPSETQWWDKKMCESKVSGLSIQSEKGGLFIKNGLTLDVPAYLTGLWQACALLGTQYKQLAILKPEDVARYDRILIAMGPLSKNYPPLKNLPISAVKGQILELEWPQNLAPLPFSLVSQKYIVMRPDQKSCLVGSTYEHQYTTSRPDQEEAIKQIMPHIASFFPPLKEAKVLSIRAACRASTPTHLPIAGKVTDKVFFFSGLGSKGLLYHAWIGKRVARMLLTNDTNHLPKEIFHEVERDL